MCWARWELYALVAVGYTSMTLNQLALDTGALAAALATSSSLDPIASVVLGLTLFDESLNAERDFRRPRPWSRSVWRWSA